MERVGSAGRFVLSDEARPFEAGDKLNLLVGLLSSERGCAKLVPDVWLLRTDPRRTYHQDDTLSRWQDPYFDLEQGEIGGNIKVP